MEHSLWYIPHKFQVKWGFKYFHCTCSHAQTYYPIDVTASICGWRDLTYNTWLSWRVYISHKPCVPSGNVFCVLICTWENCDYFKLLAGSSFLSLWLGNASDPEFVQTTHTKLRSVTIFRDIVGLTLFFYELFYSLLLQPANCFLSSVLVYDL